MDMVAEGKPGLTSEIISEPYYTTLSGETIRHVAYRDAKGNPVAAARISHREGRDPAVMDFAADKSHPESSTGALQVGKYFLDNNMLTPEEDISPDALNLLKRAAKLRSLKP